MGLEASFQMFQGAYYQAGETGGGRMGQKSYLGRSGGGGLVQFSAHKLLLLHYY